MIINLTQHAGTLEQGVVEPTDKSVVSALLTFDNPPDRTEMRNRAKALALIAQEANATAAMIGGAPYFMSELERALVAVGVQPVYAFSKRESVDIPIPESEGGGTRKQVVFRHLCFVGTESDSGQRELPGNRTKHISVNSGSPLYSTYD